MRGFIAGILLFMAISSITSAAFPARALAADRQPPVIISLSRANEPYSFVSMFGEPSGLLVDIWRLWGEKVGRDVKFRMGEWQDLMADVRSGQSQIHGGLFRSSARSQVLDFGPALFPSRGVIIMASGVSADIENSPAPVIATLKGTILETYLRTRYPALRLLSLASFKDMIMAVGGGLAQGVAGPLLPLISVIDRLGLNEKFSTEPLPLIEDTLRPGMRKGDATTLELVEQGMAQIPRAELIALEEYWVRVPAMREINRVRRPLNLSPLERQWLESHSRWRVGFIKDGAPLAFTNKQGQFDGISADILRAVAGILGVEIVPHPEVSSRNLSADLATQQIDVVPFSERLPQVHENTYLRSLLFYLPLDVVTRANASFSVTSPSDLAKKTVAVLAYPGVAAQLEKLLPSAIVVPLQVTDDALDGLRSGRYDAVVGLSVSISFFLTNGERNDLRHTRLPDLRYAAQIAFRADWPELPGIFEKAYESIPYANLLEMAQRWGSLRLEKEIDWERIKQVGGVFALLAVSFLCVVLIANHRLTRESQATQIALSALRLRERQLKTVMDNQPSMVMLIDTTGKFILVNRQFELFSGFSADAIIGKRNEDILPPEVAHSATSTDEDVLRTGEPLTRQESYNNAAGDLRDLEICKVPLKDDNGNIFGIVITATDITERRKAERQALRTQTEMAQIFNAAGSGMRVLDTSRVILQANDAFLKLHGFTREEIIGIKCSNHTHTPDKCPTCAVTRVLNGAPKAAETTVHRCKNGEEIYCDIVATPFLSPEGELLGVIEDCRDVTDLVESQKAMQKAALAAEEANRAKSEFLANMSHEIRTPMNAVIGMSYLALQTKLTGKQHSYLSSIRDSAKSLLRIINDILDFSKIEAGRMDIEHVDFELDEVLQGLASLDIVKLAESKVELRIDVEPDVPFTLMGDPLRLGQVLINLVGNAIKFTDQGEVCVRVQRSQAHGNQMTLLFSISDTGVGMSEEQKQKLFHAFSQADMSTTRRFGGTGLGLSISKRLVEMMGGTISVESKPDQGSTFCFTACFGLPPADIATLPEARALSGLRVLVIKSDSVQRAKLGQMLSGLGLQYGEAADCTQGARVAAKAATAGMAYEIALIDCSPAEKINLKAAARLKKMQGMPVIITAGVHNLGKLNAQAAALGIDHIFCKPVCRTTLLRAIYEATRSNRQTEETLLTENELPRFVEGLEGQRVLLAEDNEINQIVAKELLEGMGLVVDIADNGRIAVDMLAKGAAYAAVFMDIQMPEMDGFEATRIIRATPGFRLLPIIALTAHGMVGDREKCLKAGMDDHISKPIDPTALAEIASRWCRKAGADASGI